MSGYWLAQWLDEKEIASDWEVDHLLQSASGFKGMLEKAAQAESEIRNNRQPSPNPMDFPDAIVAGRRLDLSGSLSCPAYDCLRQHIDTTFKHVWHYFDSVVVEGLSPGELLEDLRKSKGDHEVLHYIAFKVSNQARLLLYLRSIGAEKFTIFTNKTFAFCQEHWLEHAKALGIADAFNEAKHESIVKGIVDASEFKVEEFRPGVWAVDISSGIFEEPDRHLLFRKEPPTAEGIACSLMNDFATATISDVELARRLSLPLLEPTSLALPQPKSRKTKSSTSVDSDRPSAAEVALNINLPVFDRLTTRDLLKIREDERPDFEAFRRGLRGAIQDKLASESNGESASIIARSIDEEYLRPGLAEIERKLRTSRQAVVKKTAVDLTIGATATGVATISSVPLMIAGGVAALGSGVGLAPPIHSYIEDKRSARMSDLYFLWKVGKRLKH